MEIMFVIDYFSKIFQDFKNLRQLLDSNVHSQPSVENYLVLSPELFA